MHRDIIWERVDRAGLEHLSLTIADDAITAEGLVVVALAGNVVKLNYAVRCDGGWNVREALVSIDDKDGRRSTRLVRDDLGIFLVDGVKRPDLAGCTDIDIKATPFTNTLPIRRLALRPDEAAGLRVAYFDIPDLRIDAFDQEYTRLDPAVPPRRFRYRSVASGFVADLEVDEDGIVIDYSGLWRRRCG
jgi:uncharacterized protein